MWVFSFCFFIRYIRYIRHIRYTGTVMITNLHYRQVHYFSIKGIFICWFETLIGNNKVRSYDFIRNANIVSFPCKKWGGGNNLPGDIRYAGWSFITHADIKMSTDIGKKSSEMCKHNATLTTGNLWQLLSQDNKIVMKMYNLHHTNYITIIELKKKQRCTSQFKNIN